MERVYPLPSSLFLILKELERPLEPICLNCEYFEIKSISQDKYAWGDCKSPRWSYIGSGGERNDPIFTSADRICDYFKPKQTKNTRKSTSTEDTDA